MNVLNHSRASNRCAMRWLLQGNRMMVDHLICYPTSVEIEVDVPSTSAEVSPQQPGVYFTHPHQHLKLPDPPTMCLPGIFKRHRSLPPAVVFVNDMEVLTVCGMDVPLRQCRRPHVERLICPDLPLPPIKSTRCRIPWPSHPRS